ncbi:MAG: RNA polymerase sigma factor [Lachnospiraceae bacterium]|nr:RNA polymerase sigma factor [Lachnospiraceae bacterium]
MDEFEQLLNQNKLAFERFVKFRISNLSDAEDILQDVYFTAYKNWGKLKEKQSFKAWVVSIARHKCNDYYRKQAKFSEVPIDNLVETELLLTRLGYAEASFIEDILDSLSDKDKQILHLTYWEELPQKQIAKALDIPLGTVKSRLHAAKQNFKMNYTSKSNIRKDDESMSKLPSKLPEYKISVLSQPPFIVKCEELQGLSIIPKIGEKITWGLYNFASKQCEEFSEVCVLGKAEVHGIEGVEIKSVQHDIKNNQVNERLFVAQLTDTHCRYLSETHWENGVKKCFTFLDGDIFMNNWGFGEDNCGNKILIEPNNLIKREGSRITKTVEKEVLDVVGRYTVEIGDKSYDTVCVMDLGHFNNAIAIEQYIDKNGRTILWRRFNRDDWALKRYKKKWSEQLPENERLMINGETYVHWYDCITDYII